jgi:hypothetical protein
VERWLESLDEIPDAGDDVEETDAPDLYSFHAQLAALATETRKSNRRTAEAFSQWSATVSGLDDQLARLREVLTLQPATSADALPRRWCLALVELIDRLRRVADAFAMTLPTPRLRWLRGDGGLRAAWETQRQALDIVLSHADALVASAGVTRIETMRQPFDPRTMIAVATTVDSHRPPRATQVSSRHAIAAGATCRGFGQYCGRPANCSASRKCRWSAATGSLDSPARADPGIWPTAPIVHGSPVLPRRRWETSRRWSGGGAGLSEGIGFNHASRSITNDHARKHMPIERAQIRERLLPSKQIIIVVSIPLEGRGTSSAPPAQRVHLRCDTAPERLAVEIARLKVDAGVEA